jgi:hypothetical protein
MAAAMSRPARTSEWVDGGIGKIFRWRLKFPSVPPIENIWRYAMEIGAVPGIGALGVLRARVMELDPPAIFTIDGSAKPGDRAAQRIGRNAAGAEEDGEDAQTAEGERNESEEDAGRNVDYFA